MTIRKFNERTRLQTPVGSVTRTKQAFQEESDINVIMRKFYKTGLLTHVNQYQGDYSNLPDAVDLQTALNGMIAAQEAFDSLPAALRKRFNNEPLEFLAFVDDPANADELITLGLRDGPEQTLPQPTPAEQRSPAPPATPAQPPQTPPA